jgi:hypothetical protein
MAHLHLSYRRTHNLLLISKLLSQRDSASPFTLVLDSLEQSAKCLLREYIKRAKVCDCRSHHANIANQVLATALLQKVKYLTEVFKLT